MMQARQAACTKFGALCSTSILALSFSAFGMGAAGIAILDGLSSLSLGWAGKAARGPGSSLPCVRAHR